MTHSERRLALYDLILSKPAEVIDLDTFQCGAVACIGGFAAMHPAFNAEGLRFESQPRGFPEFDGNCAGSESLAVFFGTCETTFFAKGAVYEWEVHMSHKEAALRRLRDMLVEEGDITQERADELAAAEVAVA